MLAYIRRTGPLAAICRFAAILCGLALTWTCAALGMLRATAHTSGDRFRPAKALVTAQSGGDLVRSAEDRVLAVVEAINSYQYDHQSCPATRDDLMAGGNLRAASLVDPWGRSIAYWCTDEDTVATSAGPDGLFGTDDDVNPPGPE